jgi:methyltransferase (TIGR00027 family)
VRSARWSRTAAMVGENLVFMARDPEIGPLLPRGAAQYTARFLVAAGATKPWLLELFGVPSFRRLVGVYERMIARGQTVHMALRKRFFDEEARAALAAGATQALVVGAGFDTLCARLAPEFPGVAFVEVDHPATQAAKRAALAALDGVPANLHLVAADLAQRDLADVLRESSRWDPAARSLVVAEGLLMYLDRASVVRLLAAVRRSVGPDSRLLLSFMKARAGGDGVASGRLAWLNDALLKLKGESYGWAAGEGELAPLLAEHGFRLDDAVERCDLGRRYLEPAGLGARPIGRVEFLAVADLAR